MERAVGVAPPALDSRVARWTLVASVLGSSIAFIDGSVVNVALPAIQHDLGGGLAAQQWIVDAYLLTLGSLILVGGSLGDIFGERRVFAAGVGAFGAALVLFAVARRERGDDRARVDWLGGALSLAGLGALVFGFIEQPRLGWTHPAI